MTIMQGLDISDDAQRRRLLENGKRVYATYSAMELVRTLGGSDSIFSQFQKRIQDGSGSSPMSIELKGVMFTLTQDQSDNSKWNLSVDGDTTESLDGELPFKLINKFTAMDLARMCPPPEDKVKLAIHVADPNDVRPFSVSATIDGIEFGGKLDLRPMHLVNVHKILTYLSTPAGKDNANFLVAMDTGYGKTFTQLLWYIICQRSGVPVCFSVPNSTLVEQFMHNAADFLPDELLKGMGAIDERGSTCADDGNTTCIVTTHNHLLRGDLWRNIVKACRENPEEKWYVSFDEEHEIERELLVKRLEILSKNAFGTLFLSATPSGFARKMVNKGAVISLSMKEKEVVLGLKPMVYVESRARKLVKRAPFLGRRFFFKLAMKLIEKMEPERLSPAHECWRRIKSTINIREERLRKIQEDFLKEWRVRIRSEGDDEFVKNNITRDLCRHISMNVGMFHLLCVQSYDVIVNIAMLADDLGDEDVYGSAGYGRGNVVERDDIYGFMGFTNHEGDYAQQIEKMDMARRLKIMGDAVEKYGGRREDIETYVDLGATVSQSLYYNVLHGLIECLLRSVLDVDSITMDEWRYTTGKAKEELIMRFEAAINDKGRSGIEQILKDKLNRENPAILALCDPSPLDAMMQLLDFYKQTEQENRMLFVENWSVGKGLHDLFNNDIVNSCGKAFGFASKYKVIFSVEGLEDAPQKVENKLFTGMSLKTERVGNMYNKLDRELSLLELTDDNTPVHMFTPQYIDGDIELGISLQKLFWSTIVSNKLTTGYNNPDLHSVAIIVDEDSRKVESEKKQGFGRLRCSNRFKADFGQYVSPEGFVDTYDMREVSKKADYYHVLSKGNQKRYKQLLNSLGARIGRGLLVWIQQHIRPDGSIDDADLAYYCEGLILEELLELYTANYKVNARFCYDETIRQFSDALCGVARFLESERSRIGRGNAQRGFNALISNLIAAVSRVYYSMHTFLNGIRLRREAQSLISMSRKNPPVTQQEKYALTYAKVMTGTDWKQVSCYALILKATETKVKREIARAQILMDFRHELDPEDVVERIKRVIPRELHCYISIPADISKDTAVEDIIDAFSGKLEDGASRAEVVCRQCGGVLQKMFSESVESKDAFFTFATVVVKQKITKVFSGIFTEEQCNLLCDNGEFIESMLSVRFKRELTDEQKLASIFSVASKVLGIADLTVGSNSGMLLVTLDSLVGDVLRTAVRNADVLRLVRNYLTNEFKTNPVVVSLLANKGFLEVILLQDESKFARVIREQTTSWENSAQRIVADNLYSGTTSESDIVQLVQHYSVRLNNIMGDVCKEVFITCSADDVENICRYIVSNGTDMTELSYEQQCLYKRWIRQKNDRQLDEKFNEFVDEMVESPYVTQIAREFFQREFSREQKVMLLEIKKSVDLRDNTEFTELFHVDDVVLDAVCRVYDRDANLHIISELDKKWERKEVQDEKEDEVRRDLEELQGEVQYRESLVKKLCSSDFISAILTHDEDMMRNIVGDDVISDTDMEMIGDIFSNKALGLFSSDRILGYLRSEQFMGFLKYILSPLDEQDIANFLEVHDIKGIDPKGIQQFYHDLRYARKNELVRKYFTEYDYASGQLKIKEVFDACMVIYYEVAGCYNHYHKTGSKGERFPKDVAGIVCHGKRKIVTESEEEAEGEENVPKIFERCAVSTGGSYGFSKQVHFLKSVLRSTSGIAKLEMEQERHALDQVERTVSRLINPLREDLLHRQSTVRSRALECLESAVRNTIGRVFSRNRKADSVLERTAHELAENMSNFKQLDEVSVEGMQVEYDDAIDMYANVRRRHKM